METLLLLSDPAYVEERYHAIETERQRRLGQQRAVAVDAAAVWPLSSAEKEILVMGDILSDLSAHIQHALETQAEPLPWPELTSSPTPKDTSATKTTVAMLSPRTRGAASTDVAVPPSLDDLPMASQLALKLFFRVCASMRSTMHSAATANGSSRLFAVVAAKIPSMLAKLPGMALSPGVMGVSSSCSSSTALCPPGDTRQASCSVFEELLEIFGTLLATKTAPRGVSSQTEGEKTALVSLSDADRANMLMAYVAVALKWGRLRDLVHVMLLLIENPGMLSLSHTEQLATLVAELTTAEAVAPACPLLPEESSASGYLVSFGKGDHGKLGHGQCSHASCAEGNCTENKNVPTVIASTSAIKFVKIDSLSTHSIAITTKGELMAWGNGDKYRLGHGTATKEYAPRIIDSLSLMGKVADVACGLGHTIALMATGDIYAWGNGSNGRLGLGDTNDRSSPTKLTIAMDSSNASAANAASSHSAGFRYVMCGASHSLAVTSDGRVFAWGKNNQGQCGHGHTNDQLTAIEVRHFREELSERVVWAAGGWEHTLFCATSGRVYSCGCGYKDSRRAGIPPVLGHGDCEKRLKPTVIQTFLDAHEEMVRVSCGWDHSLAVSAQGSLYTWGSGTNGKLGHGDEENCETPTLVRSLAGKVVKDAKAGCEHTVALTDSRELWTFGQGDSGRLGLGDTVTRKVPTMVDVFTHSGLQPVAIAVGDKYNLILAEDAGPSSHQGAKHKTPSKHAPASPTKLRGSMSDHQHPSGRTRRNPWPQSSLLAVKSMRDLNHFMVATNDDEDVTASPRDQDQLLKIIALNVARIATGYMSSLWSRAGGSVERLPYGIDASALTLERLLTVIRMCQEGLSQPSPPFPPARALEMIVVCLRLLTVNVSIWSQRAESSETLAASSLLAHVGATANELAWKGVPPTQQVLDSDRFIHLQSLVQEEAAQVLRVGFMAFYPSTLGRTKLLCEFCESPLSTKLSPRALVLASKLCEDTVAHDIVLETFRRSAAHECVSIPRGPHEARTTQAESNGVPWLLVALVDACAQDANQRLERAVVEPSEAVATQLRLLTVLQGHWFGVAACGLSISCGVQGDASTIPADGRATASSICDCCVHGLCDYLCVVFDEGVATLKKMRKAVCQSNDDMSVGCLDVSFIDSVVMQAVQATCALLLSLGSIRSSRGGLSVARALLPGVRCMLEVLDEIAWKPSSSTGDKNGHAEIIDDRLAGARHTWTGKLGHACALLSGQIASCLLTQPSASRSNQASNTRDDFSRAASQPGDDPDDSSSCFRDGLNVITELLRQVHSPGMKCALLLKLSEAIKTRARRPEDALEADDADLPQTLTELCIELTGLAATEELPTRARATALSVWLWVLRDAPVAPARLLDIMSQSGIVIVAGDILLHSSSRSRLDGMLHRGVQQQLPGAHRSQPLSRLRPVEEIISTVQPSQALCLMAHQVFTAAANQLCSSPSVPASGLHPLLTVMHTEISKAASVAALPRPTSSSPRRRHTLPKKPVALSGAETIKAVFDYVCCLLQRSVETNERRNGALSPFLPSRNESCSPSAAFLLASPLSVSSTRSQIVKLVRLPSVADASQVQKAGPIKAISLWFLVDSPPHPVKEATHQPVVVLAGLGDASDRFQEGASSTGPSMAPELGVGDSLRAFVFLSSEHGQLCLGYALAHGIDQAATGSDSPQLSVCWESIVVDPPVEVGRWIHVSISCAPQEAQQQAEVYVNGKRANGRSTTNRVLPTGMPTRDFGELSPRLQLVAGGTLDVGLAEAMGLSTPIQDGTTVSSPLMDVLVDDVWLFPGEIDDALAQRLCHQGLTIVQLKQEYDADQKTLAVLDLLNQMLALLPIGTEAPLDPAGDTVSSRLQCALLKLLCTRPSESSCQIAWCACDVMKRIFPCVSAPSRDVLDALMVCIQRSEDAAVCFDVGYEVAKLYAFSTRAGVQSAVVSASQVTVASLLRQVGILKVSSMASGSEEDRDFGGTTKYQHVLFASVVSLLQTLSGRPAWQPHCRQLLDNAAAQLSNGVPTESSLAETLAAVAMVAGYSEGFVNAETIALGAKASMALEAPWTSTLRSPLAFSSGPYARSAWRFGCDFQDSMWNFSGRSLRGSDALLAHDMAVLGRVRLQTLALRSFVGPLRSSPPHPVTDWRHRILSDPHALDSLLCAALVRTPSLVKTRLGPDHITASKLISVQQLKDTVMRSRARSPGYPRLLLDEDLEVLTSEIQAKLERQQRAKAYDAGSILRQHYWRDPRLSRTPLESLSGDVEIRGLAVRAVQHFPTVRLGRVTITANSGLWYYEIKLLSDGLVQIGYVDTEFVADAVQGQGVGDHTNSWAFDGYRRKKWNVSSCDYGESWRAGDRVGVLLDTDRMELSYVLNDAFLGVAFSNLPLSSTSLLFPAISLNADQRVEFDLGARSTTSGVPTKTEGLHRELRPLRLPSLGSPLDTQRLRPVALAMDESPSIAQDSSDDEPVDNVGDCESEDGDEDGQLDDPYSPLATPTTTPPSSHSSRFQIYHPTTSSKAQLPGSLHGDEEASEPVVPGSLVHSIQAAFGGLRDPTRDHSEDADPDDNAHNDGSETEDPKTELVEGLVALGFPPTWALRCAQETSFTLNDTGAVSWILEQMEREASSSTLENPHRPSDAHGALSEGSASCVARRALDDLSVGVSGGPDGVVGGRRTWQLALSPSRDGRPHSEPFVRSRVSLSSSSPQKQAKPKSEEVPHRPAEAPTNNANPFLMGEVASDEDEDDDLDAEALDASAWITASARQQFFLSISSGSLRQRFARLDLRTNSDLSQANDETTPRRQLARGERGEEDLLPACVVAHSILSLAYVRLLAQTLLFDHHASDLEQIYPVLVQWASTSEKPGLFRFLRMQLQLDARELPVSCSRSAYPSEERTIQLSFTRFLRFELENAQSTSSSHFPLHQAVVAEILAQLANAIRDVKRVKILSLSIEKVLAVAMNARWTLWLVSALRSVSLRRHNDAAPTSQISIATRRTAIQALLEPACISNVTRLAASATSATTLAWRNSAFAILHHVLLLDTATRTPLLDHRATVTIPSHVFVELLARMQRKDQSKRIAFAEPSQTLWRMVLAHSPRVPHSIASRCDATLLGAEQEITLRVEQVASTFVMISWECVEPPTCSLGLDGGRSEEANASPASPFIDSSVLSLRVIAGSCDSNLAADGLAPSDSPSNLASGVPHFLPNKGSLVLRQLAPDTNYTIRIIRSSSPLTVGDSDSLNEVTAANANTSTAVVTQEALVRTPLEPLFELDPEAAGKHLVLLNRNRTVKNQVNKKWHTVRASVGFDEGVHHWHVRIDTCVSKNIFIGVATCDASLENYVGSDAFGYGFLANKAVWHNKSKLHTYGEVFKQGDLLQVTLDCHARTLAYSRNGEFLGVAATNLHVATNTTSDTSTAASAGMCKWYPTFSLYNKDDQLTLLVPPSPSATPSGVSGLPSRAASQHASVLALVASARRVLTYASERLDDYQNDSTLSYAEVYSVWRKWTQGDVCWREVALGEVIEIDAQRDTVARVFGLAPGDAIFTSRGQCVVLGCHNHELWYEIIDALGIASSGNKSSSSLGNWSLSVCRAMVSAPDEYPVHRVRRYNPVKVLERFDETQPRVDDGDVVTSATAFHQIQAQLAGVPHLDRSLVSLVDAIVAHRGLGSAYQLSCADLSSAILVYGVLDALCSGSSGLGQDALLMRLAWVFHVNQHAYRVVRLFLTQDDTSRSSRWEQSVCCATAKATRTDSNADPEKERRATLVAAARLAATVQSFPLSLEGTETPSPSRLLPFLRTHLFDCQREQLISEALRRTATPTLVALDKGDSKPGAELDAGLMGGAEPKDMLRLQIRLPSDGPATPFWQSQQPRPSGNTDDPTPSVWVLPARDCRARTVFAQVSAQLSAVDPAECRRQYTTPHQSESLSVSRSFQLAFLEPSSDSTSDPVVVLAEHASQYLQFWDELFTEIQSPRFPLLVPTDTESPRELHVNAYLLLPEHAVRCGVHTDEVLAWFFQLGQLLGMVWRAQAIVPLQFVSMRVWQDLLLEDNDNDWDTSKDRLRDARKLALGTVREGICSIVPHECLQLSSPETLRNRLADTDICLLDRLEHHAAYDCHAPHHAAFWATVRGFSSLERHALVGFLRGKAASSACRSSVSVSDDLIEAWKRQVSTGTTAVDALPLFQLELVDALADAQNHPDACFPVVHVVDAERSRLHLPAYSSASVLRQKLLLAITTL